MKGHVLVASWLFFGCEFSFENVDRYIPFTELNTEFATGICY